MKIGLTGPSGSGKTTLANYISVIFEIPFIPQSAGIIISEQDRQRLEKEFNYQGEGHRKVIMKSMIEPKFGIEFQSSVLNARVEILNMNEAFVSDRTLLDNLAYFLLQCSPVQDEKTTGRFIDTVIEYIGETMTHLIIIKPNDGWTEDNGSRVSNNFYQHMTYEVFLHAYNRYLRAVLDECGIKVLIIDTWDLEQRKNLIDEFLAG